MDAETLSCFDGPGDRAAAWLCSVHHDDKTYRGWQLTGPPHNRRWNHTEHQTPMNPSSIAFDPVDRGLCVGFWREAPESSKAPRRASDD